MELIEDAKDVLLKAWSVRDALERAFKVLEKVEARLDSLERSQPMQQRTTDWVTAGVWAAVCALAYFTAKKVGLV